MKTIQVFNVTLHTGEKKTVIAKGWVDYIDYYGYPNFVMITRDKVKWFTLIGTLKIQPHHPGEPGDKREKKI